MYSYGGPSNLCSGCRTESIQSSRSMGCLSLGWLRGNYGVHHETISPGPEGKTHPPTQVSHMTFLLVVCIRRELEFRRRMNLMTLSWTHPLTRAMMTTQMEMTGTRVEGKGGEGRKKERDVSGDVFNNKQTPINSLSYNR